MQNTERYSSKRDNLDTMTTITIYTTRVCGYCVMAKRLMDSKGLQYTELDVSMDHEKRAWLLEQTGRRTVPQIFFDDQSIGGYTELAQLNRDGFLDTLLETQVP